MKFKIGDKVIINGKLYKSSNALISNGTIKNKETTITRIAKGTRHPYNTTGDLGWMDESSIKLVDDKDKYEVEIELVDKDGLIEYLKTHNDKIVMINSEDLKRVLDL